LQFSEGVIDDKKASYTRKIIRKESPYNYYIQPASASVVGTFGLGSQFSYFTPLKEEDLKVVYEDATIVIKLSKLLPSQ